MYGAVENVLFDQARSGLSEGKLTCYIPTIFGEELRLSILANQKQTPIKYQNLPFPRFLIHAPSLPPPKKNLIHNLIHEPNPDSQPQSLLPGIHSNNNPPRLAPVPTLPVLNPHLAHDSQLNPHLDQGQVKLIPDFQQVQVIWGHIGGDRSAGVPAWLLYLSSDWPG